MSQAPSADGIRNRPGPEQAAGRLAALLQMEERLRRAEKSELPFIVVNETRLLAVYRQAVLWRVEGRSSSVMAVSGVAVPDKNAPYLQWLGRLNRRLLTAWEKAPSSAPLSFTAQDVEEDLRKEWAEWLPAYGLFLPLPLWPYKIESSAAKEEDGAGAKPPLFGALVLFSPSPFAPADLRTLGHLAGAYAQSLSIRFAPRRKRALPLGRRAKIIVAALLLILLFPVRQSVLAPGEVIAGEPWPIRSPLDGIVEKILVAPNAEVRRGEPLLKIDDAELKTRLAVARKSLEVAQVELRQGRQQALGDREAKLRLAHLSGRAEQLEAEKNYVESLLERSTVLSPIDGVALVDAPEEWAGKPVSLGQRLITVADPARVRLEIFLPMNEFVPQQSGDRALFFPNISPGSPYEAFVYQVGYQAEETPQAGLAFRLRAEFGPEAKESLPRLGSRGTAKLYGSRAPLIYVILRQPIMKMRQWLGV